MVGQVDKLNIDNTGFGNIRVLQRPGLGYGVDAVLLAAFAAGETGCRGIGLGARIADLGTGSGIVSFVLAHKVQNTMLTGFDVRADAIRRAEEACRLNELTDRITFINQDISSPAMREYSEGYDAVVTNPPYFRKDSGITSNNDEKYVARHETTALLHDFVRTAAAMLKDRGSLYMVHRPDRMVDIMNEMRAAGIEPKTLQLVVPRPGEAANILLIHGIKGAGAELLLLPEIAVRNVDNEYSDIINRIYER